MFPHSICIGSQNLITIHVIADLTIFVSYIVISAILVYFRKEIALFRPTWVALAFATFIFSCGFTHLMDVVVLWYPVYRLQAGVKLVCAISSVVTAAAMPNVFLSIIKSRSQTTT